MSNEILALSSKILSEIKDLNKLTSIENKNKFYLLFVLFIKIVNKENE
jgi:hypothetical protein